MGKDPPSHLSLPQRLLHNAQPLGHLDQIPLHLCVVRFGQETGSGCVGDGGGRYLPGRRTGRVIGLLG